MSWNRVIGQERVTDSLRRMVAGGRVAHAYLFHGPDGTGKRAAALAFAQTLQCIRRSEKGGPCGACPACHRAQTLQHPDIRVLLPLTSDATPEEEGARVAILATNPYETIDFQRRPSLDDATQSSNKQVAYRVDRINEDLRRSMSFRPVEGGYRVAILIDADLLRMEAANAFLKLLEEPGDKTVFILLTDRLDQLLPTVLSRCQKIRFDVLDVSAIERALINREGIEPSIAATLARMADGSYSRALELASNEELHGIRTLVIDYLRQSYGGKGDSVVALIDRMNALGREHMKFMMQVLLGFLRDLYLYSETGRKEAIVNIDQMVVLERFASNLPDARPELMIEAVERIAYLLERNVNVRLALTALSQTLARAMRGDRSAVIPYSLTEDMPV